MLLLLSTVLMPVAFIEMAPIDISFFISHTGKAADWGKCVSDRIKVLLGSKVPNLSLTYCLGLEKSCPSVGQKIGRLLTVPTIGQFFPNFGQFFVIAWRPVGLFFTRCLKQVCSKLLFHCPSHQKPNFWKMELLLQRSSFSFFVPIILLVSIRLLLLADHN